MGTAALEKVTGTMEVMDSTGHTEITWDKDDETSVAIAKAAFEGLMKDKKYAAVIQGGARNGQKMTTFDKDVESVKLVPAFAGG